MKILHKPCKESAIRNYDNVKTTDNMKKIILLFAIAAAAVSCCKDGHHLDTRNRYTEDYYKGWGTSDGGTQAGPGVLTASEWNDLSNWNLWSKLMTTETSENGEGFSEFSDFWGLYTGNRVAVHVAASNGTDAIDAKVELLRDGQTIWETRTDNKGKASLWVDVTVPTASQTAIEKERLTIKIGGELMQGNPDITNWDANGQVMTNDYTIVAPAPEGTADIAFIVDATGSMIDEIDFLKSDLVSILNVVSNDHDNVALRTGMVFYRDEGDDYVTKTFDFVGDFAKAVDYVRQQHANGGGDTPEAVDKALESALSELSWSQSARARLAFMILDAPAHKEASVIQSLQGSIAAFAAKGIRIIPIFCSSDEKSCELMSRQFAILTGGTYVYLTNDSGVGNGHVEASTGDTEVEKLNDLVIRLINEYIG